MSTAEPKPVFPLGPVGPGLGPRALGGPAPLVIAIEKRKMIRKKGMKKKREKIKYRKRCHFGTSLDNNSFMDEQKEKRISHLQNWYVA